MKTRYAYGEVTIKFELEISSVSELFKYFNFETQCNYAALSEKAKQEIEDYCWKLSYGEPCNIHLSDLMSKINDKYRSEQFRVAVKSRDDYIKEKNIIIDKDIIN